jgi:3-isopropylmalate/(R)-2-methylmalate dehydratase small subunit
VKAFDEHVGVAMPLPEDNINTDVIIPSREMRTVSKSGLADGLFAPWRYLDPDSREENPSFAMNKAAYRDASILIAGKNFGCGSSREHAVWALMEAGFKVVIAESFATIFYNNALRNGLLAIALDRRLIDALAAPVRDSGAVDVLSVNLTDQTISAGAMVVRFEIDPDAKEMLLEGMDEISLTQRNALLIEAFERRDRENRPWIYLND